MNNIIARTRVRFLKLKLDNLSFDQQCELWRKALAIDDRLLSSRQFANWAVAHQMAIAEKYNTKTRGKHKWRGKRK